MCKNSDKPDEFYLDIAKLVINEAGYKKHINIPNIRKKLLEIKKGCSAKVKLINTILPNLRD